MYIEPNTNIHILKGVPLDTSYEHSINFTSRSAQTSYFLSKSKYNLAHYTYQRVQKGVIRVGIKAESLYDCNYVMFQNSAFGNKWFYAFIKSVEYVNNECSEVTFEMDVLQTWHFDYSLGRCFVERQHSITDEVGDNLVAENLNCGDYFFTDQGDTGMFGNYNIIAAASFDVENGQTTSEPVEGAMYSGIYSGLKYVIFDSAEEANEFLTAATKENKSQGIVSVFMFPKNLLNTEGAPAPIEDHWKPKSIGGKFGEYTPKNKKMYTYPYNFLSVFTGEGASIVYRYEYFSDETHVNYGVLAGVSCSPEVILYPLNYKGVERNYNERISLTGFPQCAYTIDSYRAWVASRGGQAFSDFSAYGGILAGGIGSVAAGATMGTMVAPGAGTAIGGMAGAVAGAVGSIVSAASSVGSLNATQSQPGQTHGGSNSVAMASVGEHDFHFYNVRVRQEYAEIIDGFFTRYGYAQNRHMIPNRQARQHFTYMKLSDVTLNGSIPCDDANAIIGIYQKGLTWWRNGDEVGMYGLDNGVWG